MPKQLIKQVETPTKKEGLPSTPEASLVQFDPGVKAKQTDCFAGD